MSFQDLDKLTASLEKIDRLQCQIDQLKSSNPDAYARVLDAWKIESTYNSNNIEGSTLSLGDTALVFEGAVPEDASKQNIDQAIGGKDAVLYAFDCLNREEKFSEQLIKGLHYRLFCEALDPETRGNYRDVEVEITGTHFEPAPSRFVPERMFSLMESIRKSKRHPVMKAILFHLEFESIHPFVNANGRTGRLDSNYILMSSGFEPVNIQASDRKSYIAALRAFSEQDDPYPFAEFFVKCLIDQQQKCIDLLSRKREGDSVLQESSIVEYLSKG